MAHIFIVKKWNKRERIRLLFYMFWSMSQTYGQLLIGLNCIIDISKIWKFSSQGIDKTNPWTGDCLDYKTFIFTECFLLNFVGFSCEINPKKLIYTVKVKSQWESRRIYWLGCAKIVEPFENLTILTVSAQSLSSNVQKKLQSLGNIWPYDNRSKRSKLIDLLESILHSSKK